MNWLDVFGQKLSKPVGNGSELEKEMTKKILVKSSSQQ